MTAITEESKQEVKDFKHVVLNNDSMTERDKVEQLISMLQMMMGGNIELLDYIDTLIDNPNKNSLRKDADYLDNMIGRIWKNQLDTMSNILMEWDKFLPRSTLEFMELIKEERNRDDY